MLSKWYSSVNANPGFTEESLKTLSLKAKNSSNPVICALMLDEMAIRQHIDYDGTNYYGHVDIGNGMHNDSLAAAKECLVIMVFSVNENWKLTIGYFLVNSLNSSQKAELDKHSLNLVLNIKNLNVDHLELFFGCIRDQGGYNNNPTSKQFMSAYRKLVIKVNNIESFNSRNCIPLENVDILHYSSSDPIKTINNNVSDISLNLIIQEKNQVNVQSFIDDHDYLANNNTYNLIPINYLEDLAIVYSYRVDNLAETTSRLIEEFKSMNFLKSTTQKDEDNAPKIQKPKYLSIHKLMLTTNEKLRLNESTCNPTLINHSISIFNCNELFSTNRPSYLHTSIHTSIDRQKGFDEIKKNEETIEVPRSFLDIVDKLFAGDICTEFNGFVAEHDKVDKSNNYNFLNNSEDFVFDKPDKNEIDFWNVLTVLIEIIVVLILNFFFNWKGPNSWKAQAMVKALKLCTPNERKYLVSNMDESISDTQTIVDFKYKFNFLQYAEIKPDWWIHKNQQKYNSSEASNSCQNINNCGESISKILDAMQIDNEYSEQSTNRNYEEIINDGIDDESLVSGEFNSDDEDVTGNITTESKIDIAELKNEISDTIDDECVLRIYIMINDVCICILRCLPCRAWQRIDIN
ncbi:hypothetical protein QTP88_027260 [Uroleucon formosanum]